MNNILKPKETNKNFNLSKITVFIVCSCLLVFGIVYFPSGNLFSWDVFGYYLYLPLTFIYQDLGIHDLSVINDIINKYHNTGTFYQASVSPTGDYVIKYTIGSAVLYSPFFFIGHLFAFISGAPMDGFSTPYQYSVWAGCMLYSFLGVIMLRKIAIKFFDDKISSFLIIAIILGTNYFLHASAHGQGAMTHNQLFTLYTFIIWFTIRWHETYQVKYIIYLALSVGITGIVRPTELVSITIPLLWGVHNKDSLVQKYNLLKKESKQLLIFFILLILIGSVQLIYWKIYAGSFIYDSYTHPGEGLDILFPHTIKTLFSFRNGWLIYTPIMIFALIGFFILYKEMRPLFWAIFGYFLINLWIVSSWTLWWGAAAFGQRFLISSYPALLIPMGYFLTYIKSQKKYFRYLAFTFIIFFIALNLFQTWQVLNGILISSRSTAKFYFAVFGRTSPLPNAEKLLYKEWPTSGEEVFNDEKDYKMTHIWKLDFENEISYPENNFSSEIYHSGKRAFKYDSLTEFGPAITKKYSEITDKYHAWIRVSVWVYPLTDMNKYPACVVTTFTHKGKAYKYKCTEIGKFNVELNKWNHITIDYLTPEVVRDKDDMLNVYIWNHHKSHFLIDDLEVKVYEPKYYPFTL